MTLKTLPTAFVRKEAKANQGTSKAEAKKITQTCPHSAPIAFEQRPLRNQKATTSCGNGSQNLATEGTHMSQNAPKDPRKNGWRPLPPGSGQRESQRTSLNMSPKLPPKTPQARKIPTSGKAPPTWRSPTTLSRARRRRNHAPPPKQRRKKFLEQTTRTASPRQLNGSAFR